MDILTHALSGAAVATSASTFVKTTPLRKVKIILTGTLGGMLPDIDAISMWPRFDATFGKLFGLADTGKIIYSNKFWYSHHAFFHSLTASILLGILLILSMFLIRKLSKKSDLHIIDFTRSHIIYFVVFVLGIWAHLAGDLPTPASAWGGIALWWPSENYTGGYGKIWWWNNYDIFLLITCCTIANLTIPMFRTLRDNAKAITTTILSFTIIFILIQINTRQYGYAYTKSTATTYAEMEQNSKKEQQRILGKRLYKIMDRFDRTLRIYF
ncbi:metal-dependent hydrolase [Dysgonomonas termitidis]|uniref:Metal-dependent hydrolase n=1 Tax=Dysgonomonas termitidis TaxID=1516126 RepID=A0ABV9L357_9BACT